VQMQVRWEKKKKQNGGGGHGNSRTCGKGEGLAFEEGRRKFQPRVVTTKKDSPSRLGKKMQVGTVGPGGLTVPQHTMWRSRHGEKSATATRFLSLLRG